MPSSIKWQKYMKHSYEFNIWLFNFPENICLQRINMYKINSLVYDGNRCDISSQRQMVVSMHMHFPYWLLTYRITIAHLMRSKIHVHVYVTREQTFCLSPISKWFRAKLVKIYRFIRVRVCVQTDACKTELFNSDKCSSNNY